MINVRTLLLSVALAGQLVPVAKAETTTVIRLTGSSTIGEKLAAGLAIDYARQLNLPASRTVTSTDPNEYEILSTGAEGVRPLRTHIDAHDTPSGLRKLLAGEADIWMASRQAKQSDLDDVRKRAGSGATNGPTLDQLLSKGWEHVIALDAIVAAVHPRNQVKSLTLGQLRDIFTGKAKNWSVFGGADLPITPFSASLNSGSFDVFCGQIMGIAEIADCQKITQPVIRKILASNEELADEISTNSGAIGIVGLSGLRNARAIGIGTECGTVVMPSGFAVKTEEYPLTHRLFLYAPPTASPDVTRFLDYVKSDAAQSAVEAAGFVNFRVALPPDSYTGSRLDAAGDAQEGGRTRVRPSDVHAFEDATQRASRLPITFRFQPGSDDLDSRAQDDLHRLASLMQIAPYNKMEVVLIGFTQAQGDYVANRDVSRMRAQVIRDSLAAAFSLNPALTVGVGPAAPVACNLDANARFMNQRVEAWVRPLK